MTVYRMRNGNATRQILERHRDKKQGQEGRAFKERDEP
jgi:hypothetical protein